MSGADPRVDPGTTTYRRALIALFLAGVAIYAQMYSPQALLPEIAAEFGVSAGAVSWVIGATTIGVALGVVPWARWSDRRGRAPAMRVAIAMAAVVGALVVFAPGFGTLVAVRFIEGLALAGLPALAIVTLAETVKPGALGAAIGSFVAGSTLGGLAGRLVAGTAGDWWGWRGGMAAVSALAIVSAVAFVLLLPNTRVPPAAPVPLWRAIGDNLRRPGVLALVAQGFLLMGAMVAAYNAMSFHLQQPPFDLSVGEVSLIYLVYLAGALASAQVWRVTRRIGATGALIVCIAVLMVGAAVTLIPTVAAVVTGMALITAGFFGAHAVTNGLVSSRAGAGRSLTPSMYNWGLYAGSSVLGWAGGAAFGAVGWIGAVVLVVTAGVLAAAIAWIARRTDPAPTPR